MRVFPDSLCFLVLAASMAAHAAPLECANWQQQHPEWIWCDDFETDSALERDYFDVDRQGGRFGVDNTTAFGGNSSLKATYQSGNTDAGGIKLSFGRTPVSPTRFTDQNFDDVYWRFYMKMSSNWTGNAMKMSRATIFVASNWSQAAIGHVWEDDPSGLGLGLDPVSGVVGDQVRTTKYNDFENMTWLGKRNGTTPIYGPQYVDKWICIETRMKLNTPGSSNGEMTLWIDGKVDAQATNLNFRGSYTSYGINAILLENYINSGAPRAQSRSFDNFVVSRQRIGCSAATGSPLRPSPPTNVHTN
jgi:hypothetical protein